LTEITPFTAVVRSRGRSGKVAPVPDTIREIMETSPVTVSPDTSVEDVVAALREHQLPGVPVVDDGGRVVGIVTEADLVLPDEDGDLHIPHYINLFGGTVFLEPLGRFESRLRKAFAATASDMMTRDPDTVEPDTSVREAARLIHETGHNRLPVVEDGRLVGVVTRLDVLGALAA
jgi:CBS domain-containing protein